MESDLPAKTDYIDVAVRLLPVLPLPHVLLPLHSFCLFLVPSPSSCLSVCRVQERNGVLPRELKDTRGDPARIQEYKGEQSRAEERR